MCRLSYIIVNVMGGNNSPKTRFFKVVFGRKAVREPLRIKIVLGEDDMKLQFGKAGEEEKAVILALYRRAIGSEGCTWDMEYPGEITLEQDCMRGDLFCIKEETGNVIGAVSIDKDDNVTALPCWKKELLPGGEVARLVVRKDWEKNGVAKMLLQGAMEELRKRGYKSACYLVSKTHEKALRAYQKLEFERVGECNLYEHDWWCYQKEL